MGPICLSEEDAAKAVELLPKALQCAYREYAEGRGVDDVIEVLEAEHAIRELTDIPSRCSCLRAHVRHTKTGLEWVVAWPLNDQWGKHPDKCLVRAARQLFRDFQAPDLERIDEPPGFPTLESLKAEGLINENCPCIPYVDIEGGAEENP